MDLFWYRLVLVQRFHGDPQSITNHVHLLGPSDKLGVNGAAIRTRVHAARCVLLPEHQKQNVKRLFSFPTALQKDVSVSLELREEQVDVVCGVKLRNEGRDVLQEGLQQIVQT